MERTQKHYDKLLQRDGRDGRMRKVSSFRDCWCLNAPVAVSPYMRKRCNALFCPYVIVLFLNTDPCACPLCALRWPACTSNLSHHLLLWHVVFVSTPFAAITNAFLAFPFMIALPWFRHLAVQPSTPALFPPIITPAPNPSVLLTPFTCGKY